MIKSRAQIAQKLLMRLKKKGGIKFTRCKIKAMIKALSITCVDLNQETPSEFDFFMLKNLPNCQFAVETAVSSLSKLDIRASSLHAFVMRGDSAFKVEFCQTFSHSAIPRLSPKQKTHNA